MNNKRSIVAAILLIALLVSSCLARNDDSPPQTPDDNSLDQPGNTTPQNDPPNQDDDKNSDDSQQQDKEFGVYPGDRAYDFELEDLEGNTIKLSDYKGKVVVLTFWQSTCYYCRMTLPLLDKLYTTYKDGDTVVLAINVAEDKDKVSRLVDDEGFTMPVLLDREAETAKKYLISGLPTSYIINRDGLISAYHISLMEYEQMEAYVEAAFKE
jgi:peroxiredoxin